MVIALPAPSMRIDSAFVGSFLYTWRQAEDAGVTLEQIAVLAWGATVFNDPIRSDWWLSLQEKVVAQSEVLIRDLIDDIRIGAGREPATTPKVPVLLIRYYVLSAPSSTTDLQGSTISKIRQLQILPLTNEQALLLTREGFTVEREDKYASVISFAMNFTDPIALVGNPKTVINDQPVFIGVDGTTSNENLGIFIVGELTRLNLQSEKAVITTINTEPQNPEFTTVVKTKVKDPTIQQGSGGALIIGLGLILLGGG